MVESDQQRVLNSLKALEDACWALGHDREPQTVAIVHDTLMAAAVQLRLALGLSVPVQPEMAEAE